MVAEWSLGPNCTCSPPELRTLSLSDTPSLALVSSTLRETSSVAPLSASVSLTRLPVRATAGPPSVKTVVYPTPGEAVSRSIRGGLSFTNSISTSTRAVLVKVPSERDIVTKRLAGSGSLSPLAKVKVRNVIVASSGVKDPDSSSSCPPFSDRTTTEGGGGLTDNIPTCPT